MAGRSMDFLKHNRLLKLVALAAAIMLAVYVHREADQARASFQLSAPIQAPPGERVKAPLPSFTVRVDLEGPSEMIRQITTDDLHVQIDTSRVRPSHQTSVPIEVTLPDKYDRVLPDWRPRSVQVLFEPDATKELPVLLKPLNPPEGWEFREPPRANPSRVTVSGPQEVVDRVIAVVAPFSLDASERISTTATLQAEDADHTLIPSDQVRVEPPQATITGLQERVVLQKRVPVQPLFRVPEGSRVSIQSITPSEAQLVGPKRLVADIYVVETERVNLAPGNGLTTKDVPITLAREGVQVTPNRVKIVFQIQPQQAGSAAKPRAR
jgi:YbbR domain-containing protein